MNIYVHVLLVEEVDRITLVVAEVRSANLRRLLNSVSQMRDSCVFDECSTTAAEKKAAAFRQHLSQYQNCARGLFSRGLGPLARALHDDGVRQPEAEAPDLLLAHLSARPSSPSK